MTGHYFISYSSVDGSDFALRLADTLTAEPWLVPVWLDKRQIRPGEDWDEQIVEAIRTCKGLLFIMTEDSVQSLSVCKNEWVRALKYKKPVIPLRLHHEAELPFRIGSRAYIDFAGRFDPAIDKLRSHLEWLDSPEGIILALKYRLADAKRELPRAEAQMQLRIEQEIRELQQRINEQQHFVKDPQGTSERTQERIAGGIERERQARRPEADQTRAKFINPAPAVAPSWFQDRHVETKLIGDFLKDDALRLMTVVGRAGVGKTAMVCRLLKSLELGQLPDDGGPLSVDGIVYLCATGSRQLRLPHLYADLCQLLPDATARLLDGIYRNPHSNVQAKVQALLEAFPEGRTVVLLDNFEDVVDTETGEIRDNELNEALRVMLTRPHHGVKVILTTRVAPCELFLVHPGRQSVIELDKGLDSPYAENILRAMDRDGKIGLKDASEALLAVARERTRGYPRALEALFAILAADRDSTLEEVLSDAERLLPKNVVQELVGEAFSRLDPVAQQVMQALAVYDYPVPTTAVDFLLQPHLPGVDSANLLKRLVNMQFVRREAGNYYLHHVDRAYALSRLPNGSPADWQGSGKPPYSRYSLLHRGAEYLRKVRQDESTWRSIEDLGSMIAEFELLSASGDDEGAFEVLTLMQPFLELWGHHRQIEVLANRLSRDAQEPFRCIASGVAGLAHAVLGETSQAIERLERALKTSIPEIDSERVNLWRLELAECYTHQGDQNAAAMEYHRVFEAAEESDFETQAAALLGLGSLAESRDSLVEAEDNYKRALRIYVPHMGTQIDAKGENFVLSPGRLPSDLAIDNPLLWHPLGRFVYDTESDIDEFSYLYGIEIQESAKETSNLEKAPVAGEETETESLDISPVMVTPMLAVIWMSLARLYGRIDRLSEAGFCCRLALAIYQGLEDDLGVASSLDLLRRMASQLSDVEIEDILTVQEDALQHARDSRNHRLEINLISNLAECYLELDKVDKAEALYLELLQYAANRDDPSLRKEAELGLARIEWFQDRPDKATVRLEKLLEVHLSDLRSQAEVSLLLGRIQLSQNQRDAAIGNLLIASRGYAALASHWDHVEAERLLAFAAIDQRNYEEAVERLESALQIVRAIGIPSLVALVLCDLAQACISAGAQEQAISAAAEAHTVASGIELRSTFAKTLLTIGLIRSELRDFEQAERAYKQSNEVHEEMGDVAGQVDALSGLAWVYHLMEKRNEQVSAARQAWEKARILGDSSVMRETRANLATALSDCGLHSEAIQHLEAVVNENPNDARAIGNLGWVLYQAKEYDRSISESRRALDLDATQTWTIRNLGHAYLAKGMPDDAEREYRRAIQDRKGGEDFVRTIQVVKKLLSQKPNLPRGHEMLHLLEEEQRKLDAEK